MQYVVSVFFTLHGLVHLLWFAMTWQLTSIDGLPYSTTILANRIDVGDASIRIIGLLWVVATGLWIAAALGLSLLLPWWQEVTVAAILFSSVLCILGLPDAKWGLLINIAILVLLYLNGPYQWLPTA